MKKTLPIVFMLIAGIANAQIKLRSTTKGLNLSASVHALGWASEYFEYLDKNAGNGIGGGIRAGYGITELLEPYINFDYTSLGTSKIDARSFKMTHLDFGLRVNFAGTVSALRPFVEGGYTARKGILKQVINGATHDDITFKGGTPHVGGGASFFPKTSIALFARGLFTVGKKSNLELNGSKVSDKADITTFRIAIGATFNLTDLIGNSK